MTRESMWEGLHSEVLEMIVRKLHYLDAVRFSTVCSSWRAVAEDSGVPYHPLRLTVLRTRRPRPGIRNMQGSSYRLSLGLCRFFEGCKLSRTVIVRCKEDYRDFICVGSSKNTLVLQDEKTTTDLVVLNPFTTRSFRPPSLLTNSQIKHDRLIYGISNYLCDATEKQIVILKAAVLVTSEKKNLALVIIYCSYTKASRICYWHRNAGSWELFNGGHYIYADIVARERRLFAMSCLASVDVWDFVQSGSDGKPVKVMRFDPSEELPNFTFYDDHRYFVESMGEFILVRVGVENNSQKNIYDAVPKIRVYKSCLRDKDKWEEIESLGDDRALFIGRNESVFVSSQDLPTGCEGNSIYFTDDYRTGVYNLAHKKVTNFSSFCRRNKSFRTSIWMVRT